MIKTYKANTNVSINVVLTSKKNLHITFSPLSNGKSIFTTDNEEIMDAIEHHYNFGKLFCLHKTESGDVTSAPATEKAANKEDGGAKKLKRVDISDIASAKDYLADVHGISRTILRSEKSIMEQAAAIGIEFHII